MGTIKTISNILGWGKSACANSNMSKLIDYNAPIFSVFGRDIMLSDIVKTAIHRTAEAVSKCVLKSVIDKTNPEHQVVSANDEINALFGSRVNPFMTLKDFLYKVAYLTLRNENCFIYPSYDEVQIDGSPDKVRRVYKGFYPLEPTSGVIYHNGVEARVELTNGGGVFDMPYADIIHIRHKFGAHPLLGGNSSGTFDARALLKNLQIIDTIKEGIPKAIEASLTLKGILTMKGMPDVDKQILKRDEFEAHLTDSKYGIMATDYEADFTPINITATDIPPNILALIQQEILYPFGMSLPIMAGKYTDEEYAAFYQTEPEGLLISIAQTFTAAIFTPRQLAFGHKIKVYDRLTQNMSIEKRIKIVELTKENGLLGADEQRELLGYEPNGEPTRVSLNYIDASIANAYQMADVKNKNKPINIAKTEVDE